MKRSMGWAWKVWSVFSSLTHKKAEPYEEKLKTLQFAGRIPNVQYLEIVESHSGIEIYRGEGKFWVQGESLSSLIKARRLARAISNSSEWINGGMRS